MAVRRNKVFLKAFLFAFILLSISLYVCPKESLNCAPKSLFMMSGIVVGIPQMFIGLSLVVASFLKYGEYVFSCLRLMAFLNGADCIHVTVRAGQQAIFGPHLNEGLFCPGCWRNPSVPCRSLISLPDRGPAVVSEHSS